MKRLAAVGLLAFVVRAVFVVLQTRFALFDTPFVAGDSRAYLGFAASILAGKGLSIDGTPSALAGPVYPLFLAGLLSLGLDPETIGLVQAAVGAVTVVLVGMLTVELAISAGLQRHAGERLGTASALYATIYPHVVLWTGYLLTETLFLFFVAGSLVATLAAHRSASVLHAFLAGLLAAGAALTRSAFLTCAVMIAMLWVVVALRHRSGRAALPLVFALALAVPQAAWTVRNVIDLGAPVVTVTQSGAILYQGNARGVTGGTTGYLDQSEIPPLEVPQGLTEIQRDRFYLDRALADMRSDPAQVVTRWPAKLWNMWRPTYEAASLRNGIVTFVTYVPLLLFGLLGLIELSRRRPCVSLHQTPAALLLLWAGMHMLLVGLIRYRVTGELILLAVAPFGALLAWRVSRRIVA